MGSVKQYYYTTQSFCSPPLCCLSAVSLVECKKREETGERMGMICDMGLQHRLPYLGRDPISVDCTF
jgi:hypothetical protein